jgi:hypothetical protein
MVPAKPRPRLRANARAALVKICSKEAWRREGVMAFGKT